MAKKRTRIYDPNIIEALRKLPFPLRDTKRNLLICLDNERARSNQNRLEHIAKAAHGLTLRDIESIPEAIAGKSRLKKDKRRKNAFNYFFQRKGDPERLIQIAVRIDPREPNVAKIKTIFITNHSK